MSRCFGLLLMIATGIVALDLIASTDLEAGELLAVLVPSFLVLGLLVGFLATGSSLAWSIVGVAALLLSQVFSARFRPPWPADRSAELLVLLLAPPLALMAGSMFGRQWIKRRLERLARPSAEE